MLAETHRRVWCLPAMRVAHVAGALVMLATVTTAAADELQSALGMPLFESSHSVDVSVKDGVAVYKVQRVFSNPGTVADEARVDIDLPYGAAATGLRIRARHRWFEGELMEAEKAAALYRELTGRGRWEPKDPALLYWDSADKLKLQVFPVLPGSTSTVEYTLTVPTRYSGGRVFLSYPRLSDEAAPNLATPVFHVRPGWGDATTIVKVDGKRVSRDAPLVLGPVVEPAWMRTIELDGAGGSHVSSVVEIDETAASKKTYAKAKLTLDLEHTYKSDLRISLYTPANVEVPVFGGDGGSANDVRGTFELALPAGTTGAGLWRLVVSDLAALDAGTLESWQLQLVGAGAPPAQAAADTPVFIPDAPENASDGGVAMIELEPPAMTELAARLGRVIASPAHAFGRLEIDVAPELRPLPKAAQVVFVIDASHTMSARGIDMQLAVARAYLAHVADAEVEVVLYRRFATRLFGSFAAARDFDARVEAARKAGKLEPGNGSALDEGARLAASVLAGRKGPPRIVMLTDDLLRQRWTNAAALAALKAAPAATVVHIVKADPGEAGDEPTLARDDTHALSPIALAHRGILVEGSDLAPTEHKRLVPIALGLVRPVQIDHFKIVGLEGDSDDRAPAVLREGSGVRIVVDGKAAPATVELVGMVWGDKFRRVVSADAAFSRAAAGWVFSEDDHDQLSPAEMMKVAMMGRAVSPVTSYLAIEPGVRPSTIGLERSGFGVGSGRGGMRGRTASMGVRSPRIPPQPRQLMEAAIKACVKKHAPPAGWKVRLGIESTYDEVVDVQLEAGETLAVAPCLLEAAWGIRLTAEYDQRRERFSFEISMP